MTPAHAAMVTLMIPAGCYVVQAVNYYWGAGRIGMAIALAAYAVANVGLLLDFWGI
jgi:hypothetical protein